MIQDMVQDIVKEGDIWQKMLQEDGVTTIPIKKYQ